MVWVESSSSPDPHSQVGLEGGGKKQQRGKSRNGRLEELDHCQVGGGWARPPPPPLAASVLWVPRPSLPGVSEVLSTLGLLLPVLD